jgi:hypothetical protein
MGKRRLVRARGESRERDGAVGQGRTTPDDADFAGCSPGAVGQGRTTPDDADFAGCSPRTRLKLS